MTGSLLGLSALAVAAGATALWFQRARAVALPASRLGFLLAWGSAAVLAIAAFAVGPGWAGGVAAVLALVPALGLPFTVAVSRQVTGPEAIGVGDPLPAFTASDEHGERFSSEALRGHPLLIKFFRGHW